MRFQSAFERRKRENGTNGNNGKTLENFRLFRYFRLFRFLSSVSRKGLQVKELYFPFPSAFFFNNSTTLSKLVL